MKTDSNLKQETAPLSNKGPSELSEAPSNTNTAPTQNVVTYVREEKRPIAAPETALGRALPFLNAPFLSDEEAEKMEREESEREQAEKLAAVMQKWKSQCFEIYRHPDVVAAAKRNPIARKVMAWRPHGTTSGLLLYGDTGGGKTTLAFQLLRQLMAERVTEKIAVLWGSRFTAEAAEAYGDPARTSKWLREYERANLLLADDIFKGNMTPSASTALFQILEYRTARMLPTLATTNATSKELRERAKNPVAGDIMAPLLRRIRGTEDARGYFTCLLVPPLKKQPNQSN